MNGTDKKRGTPPRRSVICHGVYSFTHRLYHFIGNAFIGRAMTGYRLADTKMHHGRRRTLRDDCRPMSPARLRLLESVKQSALFRSIGAFFTLLADAPAFFYGMILLFYGLLSLLVYYVGPMAFDWATLPRDSVISACVLAILGLPLVFSAKPIPHLLVTGRLTRWFFVKLLSLPAAPSEPKTSSAALRVFRNISPYLAFVVSALCALAALWFPPLLIPGVILAVFVAAMIFYVPEAGVVLATATLPLVFWHTEIMMVTAAVILVTWASFAVKLLLMHRALRFSMMDVAVLLFSASLCFAGMTGSYVTVKSVWEGILCFVLFSLYFLLTNLMTDRKQIYRCLVGSAVSLVLALLTVGVASLPSDLWSFLSASRGGRFLQNCFETLFSALRGAAAYCDLCLPMMAIPLFGSLLLLKRKPLRNYLLAGISLALCLGGLYLYGSLGALAAAVICLLLMLLLYSHRSLAVGILSLPLVACGGVWLYTFFGEQIRAMGDRIVMGSLHREHILSGAWRMICDHPAGIGLGDHPFSVLYPLYADAGYAAVASVPSLYMELMIYMGIPGLVLFLFMVFMFLQKTFSCLKVSEKSEDSAMILGGAMSLCALLLYGLISGFPSYFPVMLTAVILLGVFNALENVVFAEWDTTVARMSDGDRAVDRVYHAPKM